MHWFRRCIGMLGLVCIAGIALSASVAVSTETNKASLTKTIPVEDSVAGLLPNPAQYDSALDYAESKERTDFLNSVATHAGRIVARALESGELRETKRESHKSKTLSARSNYTGAGTLSTVDGDIFVEGEFVDGEIDPASMRWLKVSGAGGQTALFRAPGDSSYWEVSYAQDAKGAVGDRTSTSLMLDPDSESTPADVRGLDADALIGVITMLDDQLPSWRDRR